MKSRAAAPESDHTEDNAKPMSPKSPNTSRSRSSFLQVITPSKEKSFVDTPLAKTDPQDRIEHNSTGHLLFADTWQDMNSKMDTPKIVQTSPKQTPTIQPPDMIIPLTVTKFTDLMEQDIADAMEDLQDTPTPYTQKIQDEMKIFISTEMQQM